MRSEASPHSVAVIIEWENAVLAEADRPRQMLERVFRQAAEYSRAHGTTFEFLFLYDPAAVDPSVLRTTVAGELPCPLQDEHVRYLAAPGLHYYDQKNHGVQQTEAEIVLFVDSDVVPEARWLAGLLDHFRAPEVRVICGETHVSRHDLAGRLFSLFWFFPVRSPDEQRLTEAKRFFANNVAFRRSLLLRHPFPRGDHYRGQCAELSRQLRARGIPIHCELGAKTSHPAPNGLSHFLHRAAAEGYDAVLRSRGERFVRGANPIGAFTRLLGNVRHAARLIRRRAPRLGAGAPLAAGALATALAYHGIAFLTELATLVARRTVRRVVEI